MRTFCGLRLNADRHPTKCRVGYSPTAALAGCPEAGWSLPDAVVAASKRPKNVLARKAPHLQLVMRVVGVAPAQGALPSNLPYGIWRLQ
jgi:hypothetical protein